MTVVAAVVAFFGIVILLSTLGARRTRGRACCAPADPAEDLRMRPASSKAMLEGTDPPSGGGSRRPAG